MLLSVSYQVKVVWFHRPCSGSGQHKSGLALIDSPTKWGRAVPEHLWPWWKLIGFKIKLPVMKAVWLWCPCRVPVHFLATIKIQHSDGLPITALDCSINQGYRFKAASGIPLPTFTGRKHLNPFKNGLLVFTFHVVGLEGKPPNLAIHLIKAGMFFNAIASPR